MNWSNPVVVLLPAVITALTAQNFDLLILDVGLPRTEGTPGTSALMLTQGTGEKSRNVCAIACGFEKRKTGLVQNVLILKAIYGVVYLNFVLAFFNLLPFPPLDGSAAPLALRRGDRFARTAPRARRARPPAVAPYIPACSPSSCSSQSRTNCLS